MLAQAHLTSSQDFDGIGRHPDVDLTEPGLEPFLELLEELPSFWDIFNIDENTNEFIPIQFAFVLPPALDDFRR